MTNNHLLLYHLAELMLEKQQHILALDDLFEDEQIGAFVRSIQIDSPYQQLIFEGVLTETIKEERVMVTFTVEGYFHYVLGEVIEKQTRRKGAEALKELLETNQLRGITEGVEQCLVRDVERNDLSRLMWLIDEVEKSLETTSYPLAQAFLIHPIEKVLDVLLADPTENDIKVLEKAISELESAQKNDKVKSLYKHINSTVNPNSALEAKLYVRSIEHIPKEKRIEALNGISLLKINSMTFKNKSKNNKVISSFFSNIGQQYLLLSKYDKALENFRKSLEIDKKDNNSKTELAKSYNAIGNIYFDLSDHKNALEYFKKSYALIKESKSNERKKLIIDSKQNIGLAYLEINLKQSSFFLEDSLNKSIVYFGKYHSMTSDAYFNLGLNLKYQKKYIEAIEFYYKSLDIDLKIYNFFNSQIAKNYSNIGSAFYEIENVKRAIFNIKKSLIINKKNFGCLNINVAIDLLNLGWINSDLNNKKIAGSYLKSAKQIFGELLNKDHEYIKMTNEKLKEINDQ